MYMISLFLIRLHSCNTSNIVSRYEISILSHNIQQNRND